MRYLLRVAFGALSAIKIPQETEAVVASRTHRLARDIKLQFRTQLSMSSKRGDGAYKLRTRGTNLVRPEGGNLQTDISPQQRETQTKSTINYQLSQL